MFVAALHSVYVRCERSETDAGQDQASRLRRMWLLSIKESNTRQKGRIGLGSNENVCFGLLQKCKGS